MTTAEHLNRIAAKCRELLAGDDCKSVYAEAGWRSTIAVIEYLEKYAPRGYYCAEKTWPHLAIADIIAAWPEELL